MHDVLIPVQRCDIDLLHECIERLEKNTDFPVRVLAVLDGVDDDEASNVSKFLSSGSMVWQVLFNSIHVGLNRTLIEGLDSIKTPIFTILAPFAMIDDRQWFSKMYQIFQKDPLCGVVDTAPGTKGSTLPPVRRAQNRPAEPGCRLAMIRTKFAKTSMPIGDVDPIEHLSRASLKSGGTAWHAPGVKYHLVQTKPHPLCPARSELQIHFE